MTSPWSDPASGSDRWGRTASDLFLFPPLLLRIWGLHNFFFTIYTTKLNSPLTLPPPTTYNNSSSTSPPPWLWGWLGSPWSWRAQDLVQWRKPEGQGRLSSPGATSPWSLPAGGTPSARAAAPPPAASPHPAPESRSSISGTPAGGEGGAPPLASWPGGLASGDPPASSLLASGAG